MTAIEDRHARFLTSIRPRLDDLAPLMVSEQGRGFWIVLDPPRERQPAWWAQYGRISYLAGKLDGPNGDVALAGLREIVRATYVEYHEQLSEGEQEPPAE